MFDIYDLLVVFTFGLVSGRFATPFIERISNINKKKSELYEEYLVGQKKCPHGHEDWDDCPVCGH